MILRVSAWSSAWTEPAGSRRPMVSTANGVMRITPPRVGERGPTRAGREMAWTCCREARTSGQAGWGAILGSRAATAVRLPRWILLGRRFRDRGAGRDDAALQFALYVAFQILLRELLLDEELGLGLVLKFFEELGDFQLHLLVADFLFQSWFFRLQLLVGVCGDATDALQDDRAFRRSDQAADLAGLEAECLLLQLIVAGRVSADRGDTAAGRRQGRAGLLFGDAVEVFVALTDVGVH